MEAIEASAAGKPIDAKGMARKAPWLLADACALALLSALAPAAASAWGISAPLQMLNSAILMAAGAAPLALMAILALSAKGRASLARASASLWTPLRLALLAPALIPIASAGGATWGQLVFGSALASALGMPIHP